MKKKKKKKDLFYVTIGNDDKRLDSSGYQIVWSMNIGKDGLHVSSDRNDINEAESLLCLVCDY